MKKTLEFKGEFTLEEVEMVLERVKEGVSEDCALLNDDFSLAIVVSVLEDKLLVTKVSNVVK